MSRTSNTSRLLVQGLEIYHVFSVDSHTAAMPWKKYDVQVVGGCKATGWMFQKGDEDDSGDNGGEDSYPGGPDDHALVIHSPCQCVEYRNNVAQDERHAPVADDEINLGEPECSRRRIADNNEICNEKRT